MVTVKVKALKEVKDNGVLHQPGEVFDMEISLVKPHKAAGQIALAENPKSETRNPKAKQQRTPRDKQQRSGENK